MKVSSGGSSAIPSNPIAPNAYESYLKALGYLQRYDKPGNPALAVVELNSAVAINPRFALGYATLGEAYRLKFLMDHDPSSVELALFNSRKALALDPHLTSVHVTLGLLESTLGKNGPALQEFQKVLDLNSRDADALIGMRQYLAAQGVASKPIAKNPAGKPYLQLQDPEGHPIAFVEQDGEGFFTPEAQQVSTRLLHAGFIVKDHEKEDRFYRGLLGFRMERRRRTFGSLACRLRRKSGRAGQAAARQTP